MNKYNLVANIEKFAPIENAEAWDCSGWLIETRKVDIHKIMLCLTPTKSIINQAIEKNCDMIVSHHPMFYVPEVSPCIDIYCAHTNLDKAVGGTTDTLIEKVFANDLISEITTDEYLRYVKLKALILLDDFIGLLKVVSPNLRYVNNSQVKSLSRIAFCAGSGSEFISDAQSAGADAIVTGDLKFHTALDSEIAVFDIGHYESEILILEKFKKIIGTIDCEIITAQESCPFIYV